MQWLNLRGYLYVPFIEQIYSVKNKYIELVNKVNTHTNEKYKKELSLLRYSIKKRITHIEEFIESNFDKEYTMHFEKGKCLLSQLLTYTPYNNGKNNGTNFIDIVITNESKQIKANSNKDNEVIPVYNNFSFENAKKIKAKITNTMKSYNKKKGTSLHVHNNNNNCNNKDNNNVNTMMSPDISKQKLNNENVPITIKQIPKPNIQSNTHSNNNNSINNNNKKNISYKSNSFSLSSTISNNNDSKGKVMKLNFDNLSNKPKQKDNNINKAYNKFISYKQFQSKPSLKQSNTSTISVSNKLKFNDSLTDDIIYNCYINTNNNNSNTPQPIKYKPSIKEIIVKIILTTTEYEHLLSKKAETAFSYSSTDFIKLNHIEHPQTPNETTNNIETDEDKVNQHSNNNSNDSSLSYNSNF